MTAQIDPLGRRVILHGSAWDRHIVVGHPEMAGLRDLVERALRDPEQILVSRSDPDCRLYYAAGPRATLKVKVVVDVVRGVVKTAHLAKRVTGGTLEWSRPTP